MPDLDHAALEAAARAATQGWWELIPAGNRPEIWAPRQVLVCRVESLRFVADAAYIVAAQPRVMIALLEERKRLAERVRNLAEGRDMMGNKWAEALDRATAAEAELAALKAERDEALCIAEGPSTLIDLARGSLERGFALHAAEAERDRMKAALEEAAEGYDARAAEKEAHADALDVAGKTHSAGEARLGAAQDRLVARDLRALGRPA